LIKVYYSKCARNLWLFL